MSVAHHGVYFFLYLCDYGFIVRGAQYSVDHVTMIGICSSFKPRVVIAGVPTRRPEVGAGCEVSIQQEHGSVSCIAVLYFRSSCKTRRYHSPCLKGRTMPVVNGFMIDEM